MARSGEGSSARVLGITGPIGCGKTTVGSILLSLGASRRIDADAVVHQLMLGDSVVTRQIGESFGAGVIGPEGVRRDVLAAMVFGQPAELRRLEAIVHPAVRASIRRELESLAGTNGVVVLDAVKLLQSDLLSLVEEVWVVRCGPAEQRRRLTEIRHMDESAIAGRLSAQPEFEHAAVSHVIDNSGSLDDLRRQVQALWEGFTTRR